tara:strand:+ start:3307 stop:3510 length:204 start_codon:yes stop_codon:yes gene_type:complete
MQVYEMSARMDKVHMRTIYAAPLLEFNIPEWYVKWNTVNTEKGGSMNGGPVYWRVSRLREVIDAQID